MTLEEFDKQVRKVFEPKNFKFVNSVGMRDAYNYYRAQGGRVYRHNWSIIVDTILKAMASLLLDGKDIVLPNRLGSITLVRKEKAVWFEDGKLLTNLKIDWKKTLEMWYEDKKAMDKKKFIRIDVPYILRVKYDRRKAKYNNCHCIDFRAQRSLKSALKERIINNNLDAPLSWNHGKRY